MERTEQEASTSGRQHASPISGNKRLSFAPDTKHREFYRILNAIIRGGSAGFALKGGLHIISWVFALIIRSRRQQQLQTPLKILVEQMKDTLRYTCFLASLSGLYVGADEGIAHFFGRKRTSRWRSFVAGLVAGPSILLTGAKTRHDSLALYILLRGITLLVRCGNKAEAPEMVRKLLAPTRWKHGDTALMCLSTSQLGYSWIMLPKTLPPSYVRFLNHHGGKQLYHYAATRELANNNARGEAPRPLFALRGTRHEHFHGNRPCDFLHPGRSCGNNLFTSMPQGYLRALPVYAPVYIIPAILVHRKQLLKAGAGRIWAKVGLGTLRSSLFLSSYCALAWAGACSGFALTGTCTPAGIFSSCWTGGLATLIEKKSRRMELATYCLSRALESWALCLVEWGYVSPRWLPPRLDVIMFSLAVAAITHCYSDAHGLHRDVFRSKYLNVLDFIFGNSGVEAGAIQHVPSTQDLLAAQGLDTEAWRKRAESLAISLHEKNEDYDGGSPRSDASGAVITRFHCPPEFRPSLDE